MRIERRFTKNGQSPYADIAFREATSEIKNPDGKLIFELEGFLVPEQWSQVAADILAENTPARQACRSGSSASKRTAFPPGCGGRCPIRGRWLSCPRRNATAPRRTRGRFSAAWPAPGPIGAGSRRLLVRGGTHRLSDHVLREGLVMLMCLAPNSPQWFNTGLHWAYGIDGPGQGHVTYFLFQRWRAGLLVSAYEHPQPHACFIQSVPTIW